MASNTSETMEGSGRRAALHRRSRSTLIDGSPSSVSCRQPSLSAELVCSSGACGDQRITATNGGGRSPSRWSKVGAGFFRTKRTQIAEKRSASEEEAAVPAVSREIVPAQRRVEQLRGLCSGLSEKYEPKVFDEMIGHEMIVKALCSAVQSRRISPMYLFHGPGGTGKTSAAKVFAMALNCESADSKPCWGCGGCSRSLYTAELCAGNRTSGFKYIRTLLGSPAFMQTFPGFKVFIVDECQSLSEDSWGQLLDIMEEEKEYGSLVFIVIAEDLHRVPRAVSSRCQKFSFAKLKGMEITLKLARIVALEGIEIGTDSLRLIAKKVEGDLREAESLLNQLALLGQTVTDSMVQQLVGLVPHEKLVHLLEAVLCGDSIEAVRSTKDLIAYCIEPRGLVLQLASLITEILPGPSCSLITTSQDETSMKGSTRLGNIQPKRLYQALKILIDTEKQLRVSSCNHATWVTAALLQIASDENSNRDFTSILLPKDVYSAGTLVTLADDKSNVASRIDSTEINRATPSDTGDTISTRHHQSGHLIAEHPNGYTGSLNTIIKSMDLEEVWRNILGRMHNRSLEEFLQLRTKLMSLTVSRANAIIHLMLEPSEKTPSTEVSEESISNALVGALGCPVIINISHGPVQLAVVPRNYAASSSGKQVSGPSHLEQHKTSRRDQKSLVLVGGESQKSDLHAGNNFRAKMLENSGNTSSLQKNGHFRRGHTDSIPEEIPIISSSGKQVSGPSHLEQHKTSRTDQKSLVLVGGESQKSDLHAGNNLRTKMLENSGNTSLQKNGHFRRGHTDSIPEEIPIISSEIDLSIRDQPHDRVSITKTTEHRSRILSISSIPRTDASIEPYSQDLFFEAAKTDKQRGSRNSRIYDGLLKPNQHSHNMDNMGLRRSWSCTERFCRGETMVKENVAGRITKKSSLQRASSSKDSTKPILHR